MRPSVYLDTCILSRISDLRINENTAAAFERIASEESVEFVTSAKTRTEVLKTKDPIRNSLLQFLVRLVDKVPLRAVQYGAGIGGAPIGAIMIGGALQDTLLLGLSQVFDADDSVHIATAVSAKCRYFLTLDESTILSRVRKNRELVKRLCGELEFVDPEQLGVRVGAKRING